MFLNISWMGRGVVGTDSILRKKGIMDKIHKVVFRVLTEWCFMNKEPVLPLVVVEKVFQQHLFVRAAADVWGEETSCLLVLKKQNKKTAQIWAKYSDKETFAGNCIVETHQIEALCWEKLFIVSFMFLFSIPTLLYHQIEFVFKPKKKGEKNTFHENEGGHQP